MVAKQVDLLFWDGDARESEALRAPAHARAPVAPDLRRRPGSRPERHHGSTRILLEGVQYVCRGLVARDHAADATLDQARRRQAAADRDARARLSRRALSSPRRCRAARCLRRRSPTRSPRGAAGPRPRRTGSSTSPPRARGCAVFEVTAATRAVPRSVDPEREPEHRVHLARLAVDPVRAELALQHRVLDDAWSSRSAARRSSPRPRRRAPACRRSASTATRALDAAVARLLGIDRTHQLLDDQLLGLEDRHVDPGSRARARDQVVIRLARRR